MPSAVPDDPGGGPNQQDSTGGAHHEDQDRRRGVRSYYRGTDGRQHFRERLAVTHRTKAVQGVRAQVISDVLRRSDGSLTEKTSDWYAADDAGNVWYFDENTATYDRQGHVRSREGSWQAGVNGAVAGLIMPHDPRPTDAYRQELQRGAAEDQAWIVQHGFSTKVDYGTVHHVVRSLEWSRLEKGVVSVKFYGPHLGIIRTSTLRLGYAVQRWPAWRDGRPHR